MSTCNFSTVNAGAVYAMRPNDWNDMKWRVQSKAQGRMDRARFTEADELEKRSGWNRDRGAVVLEYEIPAYDLPGDSVLKVTGQVILQPGYYAGACLDWNLSAALDTPEYWDRIDLADFFSQADFVAEVADAWRYGREEETEGRAGEEAARRVREALEDAAARMERICRHLCQIPLRCAGVFSNGGAVYERMN